MFESDNHFSSIIKQHFSGQIPTDCKETFYIPKIEMRENSRTDKFVFNPNRDGLTKEYIINNLVI